MQRASRYRIVSIVVLAALGTFVALTACSNYGEGERCEVKNGNDDCEDGLQCTPAGQLNSTSSDRCCPVNRSTATSPACLVLTTPISTDAAPLDANTGPAADATIDAPVETSTIPEAGADGDAADAADDGG